MPMPKPDPTPKLSALIDTDPDLVDRIFDYILAELPQLATSVQKHKAAVRAEFAGQRCYVAARPPGERHQIIANIRSQFNKISIDDVAKKAGVSKRTVYRAIQPARR